MRKILVATAVSLLCAQVLVTAQMPTAGPEHKRLAYFAGTWNFAGEAKASPMGPAGAVTFKETCELMDGGFALVCRSEGKSPMGPSKAVAIMSYDVEKKAYTYTAAESGMPVFTAIGQTQGPTWTWTTESNMGGKRMTTKVTVKEGGPKSYDFQMEMSVDGGAPMQIIQGKATRAST
jgi:hypothetical protein